MKPWSSDVGETIGKYQENMRDSHKENILINCTGEAVSYRLWQETIST
jgi:hypothetical protein